MRPPKVDRPPVVGGGMRPRIACPIGPPAAPHTSDSTPRQAGNQPCSLTCTAVHQPPSFAPAPFWRPASTAMHQPPSRLTDKESLQVDGVLMAVPAAVCLVAPQDDICQLGHVCATRGGKMRESGARKPASTAGNAQQCGPGRPRKHLPIHTHTHSGRYEGTAGEQLSMNACTPPPLTVASVGLAAEPEGVAAVPREAVEPAQQELPGICRRAVIACSAWQPAAAAAAQPLTHTNFACCACDTGPSTVHAHGKHTAKARHQRQTERG